jgi:hypothetical protein
LKLFFPGGWDTPGFLFFVYNVPQIDIQPNRLQVCRRARPPRHWLASRVL